MTDSRLFDRVARGFEIVIVRSMQILLMIMIATATVVLVELTATNIRSVVDNIASTEDLQQAVQRGFAAVLVILLGLELLDTLKTYFTEHRIGAQVILVVALIAVGRHVVQLDFDHTPSLLLFGLGGLLLALSLGLFLIKRASVADQES
jgi:uncharacterized membrane protein (DUF373 family)